MTPSSQPSTKLLVESPGKASVVTETARDCFAVSSIDSWIHSLAYFDDMLCTCGFESMSKLQEHIFPSVETEIRLWAFWLPMTSRQYTGCVWADAPSFVRCTGVRLNVLIECGEVYLWLDLPIIPNNNLTTVGSTDQQIWVVSIRNYLESIWKTLTLQI